MSEVLYLHQIFTNCVSNQYTHFGMSTCQMGLQVMKDSLISLPFWEFLMFERYNFIKHLQIVC